MAGRQATEAHPSLRETSRSYHDSAVGKIQGPIEGQDRDGSEVIVSRLDLDDVDGVAIQKGGFQISARFTGRRAGETIRSDKDVAITDEDSAASSLRPLH